jgi:hypothetical protein
MEMEIGACTEHGAARTLDAVSHARTHERTNAHARHRLHTVG